MDPRVNQLVKEWFKFGDQDLQAAEKLLGELNLISCFHAQQAAEKYIKGTLLYLQVSFPKVHDLVYLIHLLRLEVPEEIILSADYLTVYAVSARYPGGLSDYTVSEAEKAIGYAKIIKQFLFTLINE